MYFPTAKLWINDLLQMPKSKSQKEAYTFKGKEIKYVDVFGVVVGTWKVRSYTMYSVDDGTGVITCMINAEHPRNMRKEKKAADIMKQLNVLDEEHNSPKIVMALKYLMRPVNEFYSNLGNITWGDTIRTRGVLTEFHGQREVRTTKIWKVKFLNDEIHRIAEVAIVYRNLDEYEKRRQSKASRKLHCKFPTASSLSIAGCSTTEEQRKSREDKGHNLTSKLQKNCETTVIRNLFSKKTIEFEDVTTKNKSKAIRNEAESCKREKEILCKTVDKDSEQHNKIITNKARNTTRSHGQKYDGTAIQDEDVVNGVKNFHELGTENEQTNTIQSKCSSNYTSDSQNNIKGILNPNSEANRKKQQRYQTKTNNLSISGADKQENSNVALWKERSCEGRALLNQGRQRRQEYSNIHLEKDIFCKGQISHSHKKHTNLSTGKKFCKGPISLSQEEETRHKCSTVTNRKEEKSISYSQEEQSRPRDSCVATGKVEFHNGRILLCEEEEEKEETSKEQTYREEVQMGKENSSEAQTAVHQEGQTAVHQEGQTKDEGFYKGKTFLSSDRQKDSSKTVAIYDEQFCKQQTSLTQKKEIKHSSSSEIIEHAFDDSLEDILRSMPIGSHDQSGSRYTVTHKQGIASSIEDCSVESIIHSGSDMKSNQNTSQTCTEWNDEGKHLKEKVYSVLETLTKWEEDIKKLKEDMNCIARNIEKWDQEGKKLKESAHCVKVKYFTSSENQRYQNSSNEEHTIKETGNKKTSLKSEHRAAAVPKECNKNRKRLNKDGQIPEDSYDGQTLREKRIKTYTQ